MSLLVINLVIAQLLDHCISFDVHISNGRLDENRFYREYYLQETTCLLDYAILSLELFSKVSHFDILIFDPLLLSVHYIIIFMCVCRSFDGQTDLHSERQF